MKSIGGYFSLECYHNKPYHENALGFNSARNALRYVIRTYKITEMYVPFYTCPVVWNSITDENCKIIPYDIDDNFLPSTDIHENAFVLYNNYFGINGKNVELMVKKYKNIIIDNAQAFYQKHIGIASVYSPRKFFGVPDGGLVICNKHVKQDFETSVSYDKCDHLLKRIDLGANAGYADFQKNDDALIGQPIKKISELTKSIMGNIDYDFVKNRRMENFEFLHGVLKDKNQINIDLSLNDVPMAYPFKTDDIGLRTKLIQNNIFVAKYWPIEEDCQCMQSDKAKNMADHIVALPIDQRYDTNDMKQILKIIGL